MQVITGPMLTKIPNPADPLGPPLGVLSTIRGGEATIVLRGPHDSIEEVIREARRLDRERRVKHRKHKPLDENRIDNGA